MLIWHFSVNIFRDCYIMKFPRKSKERKTVPMGIIPYTWLVINENNSVDECLWLYNLQGNSEFEKAVIEKYEFPKNECKLCPVNIKFKTSMYHTLS